MVGIRGPLDEQGKSFVNLGTGEGRGLCSSQVSQVRMCCTTAVHDIKKRVILYPYAIEVALSVP